MSARPVIVLLLIALALAVVTFFVVRQPASTGASIGLQPGDKLLSFQAAALTRIDVTGIGGAAGQTETLTREGSGSASTPTTPTTATRIDNAWRWTSSRGDRTYLLDGQRVAAFLRLLADARSSATANPGEQIPTDPTPITVELKAADGASTRLKIGARALGGRVLVETPSGLTMASDELLRVLTSPGPSAWRPTKPLSEAMLSASGVTIKSIGVPIAVRRASGRWMLDAPVRTLADQTAVSRLIAALDGVEIVRFADDVTMEKAGLEKPAASFEIARTAGGSVTLMLGNPADASGSTLYASVSGNAANAGSVFVVDAVRLGGLRVDARDLIHRTLSTQQEADVAGLRIAAGKGSVVRLMREGGSWSEQMGDPIPTAPTPPAPAKSIKLDPARSEASAAILAFLLTKASDAGPTASGIDIRTEPSGSVIGTISLLEPMGNVIETIEILEAVTSADRKSRHRAFRVGTIERSFAKTPPELERWLAELAR